MNKKNLASICVFLCLIANALAQETDLARIEYTYIPQEQSSNNYGRFRVSANYPIKIDELGTYFVIGAQYRFHNLQISDLVPIENPEKIDDFHTFGIELGYTFKISDDWRFGAKLGTTISSNFEDSGLQGDDFRYAGAAYFVRSRSQNQSYKKSRLILGLRYAFPASINFPLPIINYFQRFHPNWSYSIGTPKTNIKYFFNEKNTLQAFVGLDRFYANLQKDRIFTQANGVNQVAENVSMLNILGAIGYEHYFTEHILLYAYAGYTLSNEIRLRDGNQEDVFVINDQNTIYIRSGIKLKI